MRVSGRQSYLGVAALVLIGVGSFISVSPGAYLNQFDVEMTMSTSFVSDLRSMGGSLLAFGLMAFLGAVRKRFEETALLLCSVVFAAYGVFRSLSLILDGVPGTPIILAFVLEASLALLGGLLYYRRPASHQVRTSHSVFST